MDPVSHFYGNMTSALGQINSDPATFSHYMAPTNEHKWRSNYSNLHQNIINPPLLNSLPVSAPNPYVNYASQWHPQIRMITPNMYSPPVYSGQLQPGFNVQAMPPLNNHILPQYNGQHCNNTVQNTISNVSGFPQPTVAATLPPFNNHILPQYNGQHFNNTVKNTISNVSGFPQATVAATLPPFNNHILPQYNGQHCNNTVKNTISNVSGFPQAPVAATLPPFNNHILPQYNGQHCNNTVKNTISNVSGFPQATVAATLPPFNNHVLPQYNDQHCNNTVKNTTSNVSGFPQTTVAATLPNAQYFSNVQSRTKESAPVKREMVVTSKNKSPNEEIYNGQGHFQCEPMYKSFQLLGDCQFVRFAEVLNYRIHNRKLQYCVNVQTISDVYNLLKREEFPLHHSVIVLIGSHDLKKRTNLCKMKEMYTRLVNLLRCKCAKILLLTIPPIPLFDDEAHWNSLKIFNKFIKSFENRRDIFVVDLADSMITNERQVDLTLFEESNLSSGKPDLFHLNSNGFKKLKQVLHTDYFMLI